MTSYVGSGSTSNTLRRARLGDETFATVRSSTNASAGGGGGGGGVPSPPASAASRAASRASNSSSVRYLTLTMESSHSTGGARGPRDGYWIFSMLSVATDDPASCESGSAIEKVAEIDLEPYGGRCPTEGEKVSPGSDAHAKRCTTSEKLRIVNVSVLGTPTSTSPKESMSSRLSALAPSGGAGRSSKATACFLPSALICTSTSS